MAIVGILIDVKKNRKLALGLQNEQFSFEIFKAMLLLYKGDTCLYVDYITTYSKDIVENPCSYSLLVTNMANSTLYLKIEVLNLPVAPKFKL